MKVAIVGPGNRQVGKTTLALSLVNAYPHAVGKESIYVTNKSLNEVLTMEVFSQTSTSIERSIGVMTSLASTEMLRAEDVMDYAYRPTNAKSMLFDIYSETIPVDEAFKNFKDVVDKLGNRFVIMDLSGDPTDPVVRRLMDECDVWLYVVTPIQLECNHYREFLESLTEVEKKKTFLVCNKWDPNGIKKKTISEFIKIRANNILWFPYHPNITRASFEGRLCIINKLMLEGRDACLELRQPIKDILSLLCDTPNFKMVKEVAKWTL